MFRGDSAIAWALSRCRSHSRCLYSPPIVFPAHIAGGGGWLSSSSAPQHIPISSSRVRKKSTHRKKKEKKKRRQQVLRFLALPLANQLK